MLKIKSDIELIIEDLKQEIGIKNEQYTSKINFVSIN